MPRSAGCRSSRLRSSERERRGLSAQAKMSRLPPRAGPFWAMFVSVAFSIAGRKAWRARIWATLTSDVRAGGAFPARGAAPLVWGAIFPAWGLTPLDWDATPLGWRSAGFRLGIIRPPPGRTEPEEGERAECRAGVSNADSPSRVDSHDTGRQPGRPVSRPAGAIPALSLPKAGSAPSGDRKIKSNVSMDYRNFQRLAPERKRLKRREE